MTIRADRLVDVSAGLMYAAGQNASGPVFSMPRGLAEPARNRLHMRRMGDGKPERRPVVETACHAVHNTLFGELIRKAERRQLPFPSLPLAQGCLA